MADKIKIQPQSKPIDKGMNEAGEKADIAYGRGADPADDSPVVIDRLAGDADVLDAVTEDADGGTDDAFGAGADVGLAVEHGVSIPPQGFDQVEHIDADVDAAAGAATGDGGFAPPDVETDGDSVDVAGGMLGDGGLTPTDVQPDADPADADIG